MWKLKYDTSDPIYKTETESWTQRTNWLLPKWRGWGKDTVGSWDRQMYTLIERMNKQQSPTVQYRELHSINHSGKEYLKNVYIYSVTYTTESC